MTSLSIISNLTFRDRAILGSLSRRWEQICASSVPAFCFDSASSFGTTSRCNRKECSQVDPCVLCKDRFIRGVNKFMKLNKNSDLSAFGVRFCLGAESTSALDSWVRFAIGRGVQILMIHLAGDNSPATYGTYVFRAQLLSDAKESKVTQLSLQSCISGDGLFDKLYAVEFLALDAVVLSDQVVKSILSSCLNLQRLSFEFCELPAKLCISGSDLKLKELDVFVCKEIEEMELLAPNLTSICYAGDVIIFSFLEVPNLKSVGITEYNKTGGPYFDQLFKNLPPIENLTVGAINHRVYCLPMDVKTFGKLKHLELLSPYRIDFDIREMMCILKTCLLLEELVILTPFCNGEMKIPPVIHKNLKKVELRKFRSMLEQIEFVKYLSRCAVAPEEMIIDLRMRV